VTSEENIPEFVVQPFNSRHEPILARDPKVFRVAQRSSNNEVKARMSHKLKAEDLYAEFTDVENSKIRYVYSYEDIHDT